MGMLSDTEKWLNAKAEAEEQYRIFMGEIASCKDAKQLIKYKKQYEELRVGWLKIIGGSFTERDKATPELINQKVVQVYTNR